MRLPNRINTSQLRLPPRRTPSPSNFLLPPAGTPSPSNFPSPPGRTPSPSSFPLPPTGIIPSPSSFPSPPIDFSLPPSHYSTSLPPAPRLRNRLTGTISPPTSLPPTSFPPPVIPRLPNGRINVSQLRLPSPIRRPSTITSPSTNGTRTPQAPRVRGSNNDELNFQQRYRLGHNSPLIIQRPYTREQQQRINARLAAEALARARRLPATTPQIAVITPDLNVTDPALTPVPTPDPTGGRRRQTKRRKNNKKSRKHKPRRH